ncbi:helix-turn-helix domain-containing protein [Desulfovibrio sp. OttesenSCG-928-C06]|nr:helix-turn-helix domain-containing protein [Desulfovibrio sp. OttesenSCG-928-C06]
MSETVIVTTREQLKEVMSSIIGELPTAKMPVEVLELEMLKRKEYLTTDEVSKLYPLNANSLRKRRIEGEGPAYIKDGSNVLYSQAAIRKYLESRRKKTDDQE